MYIIVAISFGIMFHIRYTHETLVILNTILNNYEIEEPVKHFSPIIYSISAFTYSCFSWPFVMWEIIQTPRREITKQMTFQILEEFYDIEK
jgi:hypothetical protein